MKKCLLLIFENKGMKAAYSRDGVHPNKEAYTIIEKFAKEAIGK
jgi:lysophospholipase L1-like esterase